MLIQCAKVIGLTADRGLKNMNVLGIANGRGQRLVNLHDLCGSRKEGNEPGDFGLGQAGSFEEPGVVKNPFHFVEYGGGENEPMAAVEKFEEEKLLPGPPPADWPEQELSNRE